MMADFEKIDRNLKRMFEAKAPDEHVSAYLASEGVTAEQVSQWKQQPKTAYEEYVKPVVDSAAGMAQSAYTAVAGKHDPKFKSLPSIEDASGIIDPYAEMSGANDAGYADIYQKSLGDRFMRRFKDSNGYEIIEFRGQDGKPQQAYVNKPGLDSKDVNRAIGSALPYMATAYGVGKVAGGLGTRGNMIAQGIGAAGTSVAQDVAARSLGSKQPRDTTRAAVSGVLGAGGELLGRVAGPFIRRMIGDRSLVTPDGKLTPRGKALLERNGIDPNLVDADLAKEFKRQATNALDPAEALVKSQTDRFGIPTTKGQRTNDPQMLLIEKDIRAGTLGPQAKESLRNLDDAQKAAIDRAARGEAGGDAGTNVIAPRLAPGRGVQDQGGDVLGAGVKQGLDAAKGRINALENRAWQGTENIAPRSGAFDALPDFVQKALGPRRVDDRLTPAAHSMAKELDAYIKGRAGINPEAPEVLGQQSIRYIDEMRRRLMAMKDGAAPGADAVAAKAIYRAYDDWMVDAAEKNLLTGSPGAAQAVLNARRTTAELRGILQPRLNGKKTPAARILEKVGDAQTGEEALKALLGASGPKASLPAGAVDAVKRYKAAATQLGGKAGKDAWNDVRLAHWLKLVVGKNGQMLPNQTLITSVETAFANQRSLMNVLYSKNEQTLMRQLAQALKSATPKDPNPPGSGTAVRSLFPQMVQDTLKAQQQRYTFGSKGQRHKILIARIYRALAKVVPPMLEKNFGGATASKVTTQALTPKAPSLAGYATAFSPAATTDRTADFAAPPNSLTRR